ncbi:hypothetical protein [Vagococcus salmoninarum]|uniref:hypothetical protein n=1 Tax=Vagococcus salmoninarum TaxID=2739 RepID=UPI00188006BA|nr:hypothetical protein [Vagococcus salmoninarum]MBE9387831.1 hypothetical protein [Vagococcus salmoninarum]
MRMPNPWGDNKLDSKFKSFIEELRQFTISVFNKSEDDYKRLNKRVSNLVISSCQDNDNEVKDSRTDIDGTLHDSLHDHLKWLASDSRNENDKQNVKIGNADDEIKFINKTMEILFNSQIESRNIYVSKDRGNDTSGNGSEEFPFFTIQKAIDSVPIISVSSYFVILDKGTYKEDVVISNKIATSIEIKSYNNETVKALDSNDTGVFIRSVSVTNTTAYVALRGLTIVDVVNSPGYGIYTDRVKYMACDNLSFQENSKSLTNYTAISLSATNGTVGNSKLSNQNRVLYARYTSAVTFDGNKGAGNNVVLRSDRSIVYKVGSLVVEGTTLTQKTSAGQIFE